MSDKKPVRVKQPAQPRVNTSKKKLVPYNPDPTPDWMIEMYSEFPYDPTSPGWGETYTIDDLDHVLDRERIDELASSDLFNWRALDVILNAFIAAFPSTDSAEERMTLARKALFGEVRHGRSFDDDDAMLWEMANAIVYDQILEHRKPRPLAQIIESLFEPTSWLELGADKQKTVLTRLRRKFNEHRNQLLASVTANVHPAQKERWRRVQALCDFSSNSAYCQAMTPRRHRERKPGRIKFLERGRVSG